MGSEELQVMETETKMDRDRDAKVMEIQMDRSLLVHELNHFRSHF